MQQRHHSDRFRVLYLRHSGTRDEEAFFTAQERAQASSAGDTVEQSALHGFTCADFGFVSLQPKDVDWLQRHLIRHSIDRQNLLGPHGCETTASAEPSTDHALAL